MVDVKSIVSQREKYPNFVNGDTSTSTSCVMNSLVSKAEGYTEMMVSSGTMSKEQDYIFTPNGDVRKPTPDQLQNPQSTIDNTETTNSEATRKRKRQIAEGKKLAVGANLNSHDDLSQNGQQMDTSMALSLSEKLTILDHVPKSRKNLLILDVNGLLADIICPPPKDCKSDINISRRAIFKRPFLDDFLRFCFERFDVAIWSSRTRKVLDPVVDYLLGDLKKKLLFLWDLSHCTSSKARSLENRHKLIVFKKMTKIWEENEYYNESNTLLLDDSPYKALLNPKHTGIFPLSFTYNDINDNSLGLGGDLRVYLQGVAGTKDVNIYVEQHPFGQRAIDEKNPHWDFYSEVLKDVC